MVSGVTGKPLTERAVAYEVWRLKRQRSQALRSPAEDSWRLSPIGPDLDRARADAIAAVRAKLMARAAAHLKRARNGEKVQALRLVGRGGGTMFVPAMEGVWPGLPGLYSGEWPTTVGGEGEASLELASEAVRRGGFELLTVTEQQLTGIWERLKDSEPDDASIAEEVASHCFPGSAERQLRRLIREAQEWEYTFPGSEGITGRKPLPPPRG
jgi:hypothetical protein